MFPRQLLDLLQGAEHRPRLYRRLEALRRALRGSEAPLSGPGEHT